MDPLPAIVLFGLAMSVIALVGSATLLLSEAALERLLLPLVAVAAGSHVGGALFHLLPGAVEHMGAGLAPWAWVAGGFLSFFALEQLLHWHHCHRGPAAAHRPVTYLVLVADGFHNLLGGLAVGGAFLVDFRLGLSAWTAAAVHEVPQELGDFGVLVHGGWRKGRALFWNLVSGLTFLVGGLAAWAGSQSLDMTFLLPLAAGNFLYVGAVDLVPEVKGSESLRTAALHFACFALGLGLLLALHAVLPEGR